MKYIATFYSHFGAIRFKKICEQRGYEAKLMPVPRNLSSSCGTCVSFDTESLEVESALTDILEKENSNIKELEQVVYQSKDGYQVLFRAEDS